MFTGLVQSLGTIAETISDGQGGKRLAVLEPELATKLTLGESVAVNGVCLTVVETNTERFTFQVGPETLLRTNLGQIDPGDRVNLERALRVGEPLGGHFVTGHIDCVGTVANRKNSGDWEDVTFSIPTEYDELIVPKGSIAVDGVSLTVVATAPGSFRVMLIPHTLSVTTLGSRPLGSTVNLEFDILAKHVRKLLRPT